MLAASNAPQQHSCGERAPQTTQCAILHVFRGGTAWPVAARRLHPLFHGNCTAAAALGLHAQSTTWQAPGIMHEATCALSRTPPQDSRESRTWGKFSYYSLTVSQTGAWNQRRERFEWEEEAPSRPRSLERSLLPRSRDLDLSLERPRPSLPLPPLRSLPPRPLERSLLRSPPLPPPPPPCAAAANMFHIAAWFGIMPPCIMP